MAEIRGEIDYLIKEVRMRIGHRTEKRTELIHQFYEWATAHWPRLYACAEKNADALTDVDLLLADTLRKVARIFCARRMSDELLIRYTMRSLRNAARQAYRRNQRRTEAEMRYGEEEVQRHRLRANTPNGDNELLNAMLEALQQLPPESAALLKMKQWERLTFAEIAVRTGTSESTVRRRYDTAIELLRNKMKTQSHG